MPPFESRWSFLRRRGPHLRNLGQACQEFGPLSRKSGSVCRKSRSLFKKLLRLFWYICTLISFKCLKTDSSPPLNPRRRKEGGSAVGCTTRVLSLGLLSPATILLCKIYILHHEVTSAHSCEQKWICKVAFYNRFLVVEFVLFRLFKIYSFV